MFSSLKLNSLFNIDMFSLSILRWTFNRPSVPSISISRLLGSRSTISLSKSREIVFTVQSKMASIFHPETADLSNALNAVEDIVHRLDSLNDSNRVEGLALRIDIDDRILGLVDSVFKLHVLSQFLDNLQQSISRKACFVRIHRAMKNKSNSSNN